MSNDEKEKLNETQEPSEKSNLTMEDLNKVDLDNSFLDDDIPSEEPKEEQPEEAPAEEAQPEEAPAEEAPAEEAEPEEQPQDEPAEEQPEDAPAEEQPAEEQPEEAPAEEEQPEEEPQEEEQPEEEPEYVDDSLDAPEDSEYKDDSLDAPEDKQAEEEPKEEPKEEEPAEEEALEEEPQEEPTEEQPEDDFDEPKEKKFDIRKILAIILKGLKYFWAETVKFPVYIITHPLKGFEEFKREKRGKTWVAVFFIFLLIFLNIIEYQFTGYIIDQTDVTALHTGREILLVVGVVVILVVSNWSVTTLFDGKGKMIEIFKMIGYCIFPMIVSKIIALIFSNFVTTNEAAVYSLIIGLGTFLTGYMGLFGLISIHEYGLIKCLASIVGTVIAALVICFVGILVFDLFQKMTGFVYTIYQEISLRYL